MAAAAAPSSTRCSWRDADDATLVDKLTWGKDNGFQSDSGWKPQVWAHCATALQDSPGAPKTGSKCKDHFGSLKKNFVEVHALVQLSSFGWDDALKRATATDDVWDKYLPNNPGAARWRRTPFPLYNEMLYLVSGITATGAGAFHPGASSQMSASSTNDTQSTPSATGNTPIDTTPADTPSATQNTPQTPMNRRLSFGDNTQSSPVTGRKRAASSSPQKSPAKSGRRTRRRNADAATDMAGAMRDLASSMKVMGSPEVRAAAVQLLEEDDQLSDGESVGAMRLFQRDIAVAQTFLGSKSLARRTAYIQDCLGDVF